MTIRNADNIHRLPDDYAFQTPSTRKGQESEDLGGMNFGGEAIRILTAVSPKYIVKFDIMLSMNKERLWMIWNLTRALSRSTCQPPNRPKSPFVP